MAKQKKKETDFVYIELLKKNPQAYKRYLVFKKNKYFFSHFIWVTNGQSSTKNITSEGNYD